MHTGGVLGEARSTPVLGELREGRYVLQLNVTTLAGYSALDNVSLVVAAPHKACSRPRLVLDMHAVWLDNNTRNCEPLIINDAGVSGPCSINHTTI